MRRPRDAGAAVRRLYGALVFTAVAPLLALFLTGSSSASSSLPGCFGHSGVQLGHFTAFECAFKDADEGGTLYWQFNLSDVEYNLHPDSNHFVVQAVRTRFNNGFSTRTGFIAIVMSQHNGCVVVGAGYDQHPTECQPSLPAGGYGPSQPMTALEQASYDDFAEVMSEGIPDGYWRN